jgi:hypothetical protein
MYFTHPPVEDKEAYLASIAPEVARGMETPTPPRMLKTVTLTYGSGEYKFRVLVGSVGRRIDTAVKKKIAEDWTMPGVEVSSKQAKAAVINAQDGWDPAEELGIRPGIIGPLFWDKRHSVLAYYFLQENFETQNDVPVELALSPEASLVMRYQDLFDMLPIAQAAFTGRPRFFRVVPTGDAGITIPLMPSTTAG